MKTLWKLHTAYHPQSSGKVEGVNQILKQTLPKLCKETSLSWLGMLPAALLKVRSLPWAGIGFSPFEILYGRPPSLVNLRGDTRELGNLDLYRQLQGLGHTISQIHTWRVDRIPIPLGIAVHPHQPGDQAWVKDWEKGAFKTLVERALFYNLNYSHWSQGGRNRRLDPLLQSQTYKSDQ